MAAVRIIRSGLVAMALFASASGAAVAQPQFPEAPPPRPEPLSWVLWIGIADSRDPAVLRSFIARFPHSPEADEARKRLKALKRRALPSSPSKSGK